jgi:hypothetical protein
MTHRTLLAAAVANLVGTLAVGCTAQSDAHVVVAPAPAVVEVDSEPPPPQREVIVERPGFVWIGGHWYRGGGRWIWHAGYFEHAREGYRWEPGHYGPRHVWVEGHWVR